MWRRDDAEAVERVRDDAEDDREAVERDDDRDDEARDERPDDELTRIEANLWSPSAAQDAT